MMRPYYAYNLLNTPVRPILISESMISSRKLAIIPLVGFGFLFHFVPEFFKPAKVEIPKTLRELNPRKEK